MADNKNSFVLYREYIETFEELTNEDAGQLIKHLFRYVNGLDSKTQNPLVNLAFIPIKQQLKRDLKKYESICERNAKNGAKGGRPKKPTGLIGNPKKPQKADNDDDNDNDNDNDDDKRKRSTDVDPKKFNDYASDSLFSVTELAEAYSRSENILSAVSETTGRDVGQLKKYLPEFAKLLISQGRSVETPVEFAKYFRNKVKLDGTFQGANQTSLPANKAYRWQVKGYPEQSGSREEYERDLKTYTPINGIITIKTPTDA